MTETLLEQKWDRFRRRAKLFRYVPFVEFVLASGSMAMGTAKIDSDFDVIVGVRGGRIFTARFFAVILFGASGWRRKGSHNSLLRAKTADKICLSHFVTENSFRLSPPYNAYWSNLYSSLVPLFGRQDKINRFFENNDWVEGNFKNRGMEVDSRLSNFKRFIEFLLGERLGSYIESILKKIQIKKIESGSEARDFYKPRIIYNDSELEFHPDTRRIENYVRLSRFTFSNSRARLPARQELENR